MGFEENIQQLADAVVDSLGKESVVYTGSAGAQTISVIAEPRDVQRFDDENGSGTTRALMLHVRVEGVADCVRGASVVYRGVRYAVVRMTYRDAGMMGLWCESAEVVAVGARPVRRA